MQHAKTTGLRERSRACCWMSLMLAVPLLLPGIAACVPAAAPPTSDPYLKASGRALRQGNDPCEVGISRRNGASACVVDRASRRARQRQPNARGADHRLAGQDQRRQGIGFRVSTECDPGKT